MRFNKYVIYIIGAIIIFFNINCMDVAQVRSERMIKPVIFGQPLGSNYRLIRKFDETFYVMGGSDADERIEEICNDYIKEYHADAIIHFEILWRDETESRCLPMFFTALTFPAAAFGKYWVAIRVKGTLVKFSEKENVND